MNDSNVQYTPFAARPTCATSSSVASEPELDPVDERESLSTPLHPSASLEAVGGKRPARRHVFTSTTDVRTPEHLQKLLTAVETGRDEIGDNVVKLKAWLLAQQHEMQGWLRKQQPLPTRRLEAVHALLCVLHSGVGDVAAAIDEVVDVEDAVLCDCVPQLCDVVLSGTGALDEQSREVVRRALLALCSRSQHAALLICW